MALLEGNDLQTEIDEVVVMPVARARLIVGEICRALAAAHAKGIVHRDMKPANVFLSRTSDGLEQVKVLDFGIAQIQEPTGEQARLTQTGAIVGTPAYMSPEQGRGDRADHRADVYSVGCILYHLITGVPPFEAGSLMGVITKHLLDAPTPPSQRNPEVGIAHEVDAVVLRALEKNPAERYQTMKEMWTALAELSDETSQSWPDHYSGRFVRLGTPTPAPRRPSLAASAVVAPAPQTPAPPRSRAVVWIAGGLVLAAATIGVLLGRRPPSHASVAPPVVVAAPAVAPPAAASDVTIEVRSTPAGAAVWAGDKQIGTTPLRLLRPRASEALAVSR
jgi:serine/threonine-protein kinase